MARTPIVTDIKLLRTKQRLNQHQFWSRLGVTQSGGSRYESGRNAPAPTQTLIDLVYGPKKRALELLAELRGITLQELVGKVAK